MIHAANAARYTAICRHVRCDRIKIATSCGVMCLLFCLVQRCVSSIVRHLSEKSMTLYDFTFFVFFLTYLEGTMESGAK